LGGAGADVVAVDLDDAGSGAVLMSMHELSPSADAKSKNVN